jgi:hypothetical protein
MHEAWEYAKEVFTKAQEKKERDVNRYRREVDFDVEDLVFVSTKNWAKERLSQKLDYPMAGPYKILAKEGHSFRVDLPASMAIHPVFLADKLRLASKDPLPGQYNPPPPLVIIANDEE